MVSPICTANALHSISIDIKENTYLPGVQICIIVFVLFF